MSEQIAEAAQETNLENNEEEVKEKRTFLDDLDERDRNHVKDLYKENKKYRDQRRELKAQLAELESYRAEKAKEEEQRKMKEGKLSELIEEKNRQIEELSAFKAESEANKAYFEDQTENVLKKLSPIQADLVRSSGMKPAEKLNWAMKLADDIAARKNSPDSVRPGGDIKEEENVQKYLTKEGRNELIALQETNPTKFKRVTDLLKSMEE